MRWNGFPRGTRYYRLLAVGGVLLLGLGVLAVLQKGTSNPYFCALCHEDRLEVKAWEASSHRRVSCQRCHDAPGLAGVLSSKAKLAGFFFKHVTGLYNEPVKSGGDLDSAIPDSTCESCHPKWRTATPTKGVLIKHDVHAQRGVRCIECHNRIAHQGITGYRDHMRMTECFRCHGFEKTAKAPGKCESCHTEIFDLMPATHKTKDWEPRLHKAAARKDTRYCNSCHPRGYCISCHRLPMPHPTEWVKTGHLHAKTGATNPNICRRCHPGDKFCSSCHHKPFMQDRVPWLKQHFKAVLKQGVYPCFRCHGVTYCSYCHIRGISRSPLSS